MNSVPFSAYRVPMSERSSRGAWASAVDLGIAALVTTGYGAPIGIALVAGVTMLGTAAGMGRPVMRDVTGLIGLLTAIAVFVTWVVLTLRGYQHVRDHGRRKFLVALQVLALAVLPVWGLGLNQTLGAECRTTSCDPSPELFRVFGARGIVAFVALHALTALAFAASRNRPEKLPAPAEALVHGLLFVGIALQGVIVVQTADLLWGLLVFPVTLPLVAPFVTVALYLRELIDRLRRRGADALTKAAVAPEAVYRTAPDLDVPATADAPVHVPTFLAGLFTAPVVAGAYAVVMAVVHRRPAAALDVFTETCGHALSRLPVEHIVVNDCHYLCTVAARGTPGLVRPERLGERNGHPIVVNRQLAVANAFEDLLHTRWPRFGRLARRVYDRLGLPVSRYITRVWMADAVYLAMKPLEWAFYATLVLLDRDDPERRIGRMYRPR